MKLERGAKILEDFATVDQILAQYLGPKHPVRLELESVKKRIEQRIDAD
jgi:hypothetical protein